MNTTETITAVPPDLAAAFREALDDLARASAAQRKYRRPANAWTGSARKTGGSSASRTSPLS